MVFGDMKDFSRRTASDKVLLGEAFNIAKNPNTEISMGLASMVYKFFVKKSFGANTYDGAIKSEMPSQQLAKKLLKFKIQEI